jgi:hypothetical protein
MTNEIQPSTAVGREDIIMIYGMGKLSKTQLRKGLVAQQLVVFNHCNVLATRLFWLHPYLQFFFFFSLIPLGVKLPVNVQNIGW